MSSESFEQVLATALADGSINTAWKKFVHTRFFVPIVHSPDLDPKKIKLHLVPSTAAGADAVSISEVRERVGGDAVLWLNGAELIDMLPVGNAILVGLSDRAFPIARDRVEWLRDGLRVAQARAAARLSTMSAGGAAKAPAPASAPAAPAMGRAAGPAIDVAALRPRKVSMAELGFEFEVPASWRDERILKALHLHERETSTRVEVSGLLRPGLSLQQWLGMRVAQVGQEMRFLTQNGAPYPIEGERWGAGVTGAAVEFSGTFPGETVPGRYLVACLHREGSVVAIAFRSTAEMFEQQRVLYQWVLGRAVLLDQAEVEERRAAAAAARPVPGADAAPLHTETPRMFGLQLHGRIGRLRALAYSVPTVIPPAALAVCGALLMQYQMVAGATMVITGLLLMIWFSLRLMVLRLHDLNRSGKWVLAFFVMAAVGSVLHSPVMVAIVSVLFWLFVLVAYYILPGDRGDNDYGAPPGPNTPLVQVGAALFVLFHVYGIYKNVTMASQFGKAGPPDNAVFQQQ